MVRPTTPYDVGDMWTQGEAGQIMRCVKARAAVAFAAADWGAGRRLLQIYGHQGRGRQDNHRRLGARSEHLLSRDHAHIGHCQRPIRRARAAVRTTTGISRMVELRGRKILVPGHMDCLPAAAAGAQHR